jgi:hypothetical protein
VSSDQVPAEVVRIREFAPRSESLKLAAEAVLRAIQVRAEYLGSPQSAKTSHTNELIALSDAARSAAVALYVSAGVQVNWTEK